MPSFLMTTPFRPSDFTQTVHQVFCLWNSTPTYTTALSHLATSLRHLHTSLSELHAQAESPFSLLHQRCSDRRPEYLSLQTSIHRTLTDIQDLLNDERVTEVVEYHVNILVGKMRLHVETLRGFVDSLGYPEEARESEVLGRIEKGLLNAVFEERTGVRRRRVLDAFERDDEEGWREILAVVQRGGVSGEELRKEGRRVREMLGWVVVNEPELTRLREESGLDVY